MPNSFIEAVFEGDYHVIRGYLEGFVAASGKDSRYFICSDCGVDAETLSEHIKDWISLGGKLHHVLMGSELFEEIKAALASAGDKTLLSEAVLKSSKMVKGAHFRFSFEVYGRKYADEIKAILGSLPEGITISDYHPKEEIDEECKGAELYTVCHEYMFKGEGTVSGPVELVIPLRATFDAHPLIEAEKVTLDL